MAGGVRKERVGLLRERRQGCLGLNGLKRKAVSEISGSEELCRQLSAYILRIPANLPACHESPSLKLQQYVSDRPSVRLQNEATGIEHS